MSSLLFAGTFSVKSKASRNNISKYSENCVNCSVTVLMIC